MKENLMGRCNNIIQFKNYKKSYKNAFITPIFAILSEIFDSVDLLKLEEKFNDLSANEILNFLGLKKEDYKDILSFVLLKNIKQSVGEVNILSLDPFLTEKVLTDLNLSGKVFLRAKDLNEFEANLNAINYGIFIDPYCDGDEMTSYVSDYCAKNKIPVVVALYDDLEKTGQLNSIYNQTPIQYIENLGLLDREISILGGVYADKDDFAIISSYGAKMIICPYESMNFGRGSPNLYSMLNSGINVEIGSPIINDIYKELEFVSVVSRGLLNDESLLPINEVKNLAKISETQIKFDEEKYLKLKEKINKIKEKLKYANC